MKKEYYPTDILSEAGQTTVEIVFYKTCGNPLVSGADLAFAKAG